jgi:hypothetical protein
LIIFVVLLVAMLIFSRRDARPVDGYLTVGFPLTFYSILQNMGCLGPPLPDGTCCVDLCPPEISFAGLIVDVGLIYAASLVSALGYVFVGKSFSPRRNNHY